MRNENFIRYAKEVFDYFRNNGYQSGYGDFYVRYILNGYVKKHGQEKSNIMLLVINELILNGYFLQKGSEIWLGLTDKGYDVMTYAMTMTIRPRLSQLLMNYVHDRKLMQVLFSRLFIDESFSLFFIKANTIANAIQASGVSIEISVNKNQMIRNILASNITDADLMRFLDAIEKEIDKIYTDYEIRDNANETNGKDPIQDRINAPAKITYNNSMIINGNIENDKMEISDNRSQNDVNVSGSNNTIVVNSKETKIGKNGVKTRTHWLQILSWIIGIISALFAIYFGLVK